MCWSLWQQVGLLKGIYLETAFYCRHGRDARLSSNTTCCSLMKKTKKYKKNPVKTPMGLALYERLHVHSMHRWSHGKFGAVYFLRTQELLFGQGWSGCEYVWHSVLTVNRKGKVASKLWSGMECLYELWKIALGNLTSFTVCPRAFSAFWGSLARNQEKSGCLIMLCGTSWLYANHAVD